MIRKYNKIKLLLSLFGIILSGILYSQNNDQQDSVFVTKISGEVLVFEYAVKPGNTIFGISRQFGVSVQDIHNQNEGLSEAALAIGSVIKIPYNKDILISELKGRGNNTSAVFYLVGERETLFRIARIYTGIDIETLKKLNNLKDNSLRVGQIIYLGYLNPAGTVNLIASNEKHNSDRPSSTPVERINPITGEVRPGQTSKAQKNADNSPQLEEKETLVAIVSTPEGIESINPIRNLTSHSSNGIAVWNRDSRVRGVYVLSNDAALNTMMEITNPMLQRRITARVIGNIPENTYADNVKVVLSPDAAASLGALDTRFYVRYQYFK